MNPTRLAILGAGSVRCSPPVMVSLASYFGERPLEVILYDSDAERLDLFDRFARLCLLASRNPATILATEDAQEALAGADKVIVQVGENCARKYLKGQRRQGFAEMDGSALVEQAMDLMLGLVEKDVQILSLLREGVDLPVDAYVSHEWPGEISEAERRATPFQILRWLHGEEYLHEMFKQYERSPLTSWLDDASTLEFVLGVAVPRGSLLPCPEDPRSSR
jgi:hypothetical protein